MAAALCFRPVLLSVRAVVPAKAISDRLDLELSGFYRAMLCIRGRLLAMGPCPSVCHKSVFYRNG